MESKVFLSESKVLCRILLQWKPTVQVLFLYAIAVACLAISQPVFATDSSQTPVTSQAVDPNKGPSEFNHHIAGWALIGVGLLALANLSSPRARTQGYIWPALFLLAGLFLAAWSDGEIWPRGNLSWLWLLQHDAEARQHKIYSLLLIAIGTVEYLRVQGWLSRFWKVWAFPLIAVVGAGMLLIHDHSAGSGVKSPEAQAYLVDPDLDVDGNPRQPSISMMSANGAADEHHHQGALWESAMAAPVADPAPMPMDHSQMAMDFSPKSTAPASHHHLMTASMVRVERQHHWFIIVGLAIGLFKLISDSELFRNRVVPCIWPSCMVLLGSMLVLYRE